MKVETINKRNGNEQQRLSHSLNDQQMSKQKFSNNYLQKQKLLGNGHEIEFHKIKSFFNFVHSQEWIELSQDWNACFGTWDQISQEQIFKDQSTRPKLMYLEFRSDQGFTWQPSRMNKTYLHFDHMAFWSRVLISCNFIFWN